MTRRGSTMTTLMSAPMRTDQPTLDHGHATRLDTTAALSEPRSDRRGIPGAPRWPLGRAAGVPSVFGAGRLPGARLRALAAPENRRGARRAVSHLLALALLAAVATVLAPFAVADDESEAVAASADRT